MARDICIALGERIRELRLKRGWRQIDLAEETGMHENYVSDLEQGHKWAQDIADGISLFASFPIT